MSSQTLVRVNGAVTKVAIVQTGPQGPTGTGADSIEGTAILSTGETGGSKYLREDGDGTSSWQAIAAGGDMIASNNLSDLANASTARTNLGVDAAGTDNSTDVTLAGAGTYISLSGQVITVDPVTESDIIDLGTYSTATGVENNADVTDSENVASTIAGATAKSALVDADSIATIDSEAANALKETTWTSIKAFLKTYFDTLYNLYSHPNHTGDVTSTGDGAMVISSGAVDIAHLSATGTKDSTTFLRGDNTFASPSAPVEGTAVLSTGEVGGSKFLREDGDGTSSWQAIGGGGDALVANPLSQFAATTSAQLAGVLSDETGSGAAVFATSPTLTTPALGTPSALNLTNATALPEAQVTAHEAALTVTESQISDLGTTVQPFDADTLKADTADTLTAGFDSSDYDGGTQSSGTYTVTPSDGNFQKIVNGGAFTLAASTTSSSVILKITNNGSAGAVTTSGFTAVSGDAFTTLDTEVFLCSVVRIDGTTLLDVKAI